MVLCAFAAHNGSLRNVVILQIQNTIQLKYQDLTLFVVLIQSHENHCNVVAKEKKIKLLYEMLKGLRYLNVSMRT